MHAHLGEMGATVDCSVLIRLGPPAGCGGMLTHRGQLRDNVSSWEWWRRRVPDLYGPRHAIAAIGERGSSGYSVELASADVEGGEIVVEVVSTTVGKNCVVALSLTQPVDVAKIPRRRMGIRFVERAAVRDCPTP